MNLTKKLTIPSLSFTIAIFFVSFFVLDANSTGLTEKICNSEFDKNADNIPENLTPKKNINWSYCNLENTNLAS